MHKIRCYDTKIAIKRKAKESQDSTHPIIVDSVLTATEGIAANLPKLDSLKRTIQRQRERVLTAPVQPTSLQELELPSEFMRTANEEVFLLYDSGPVADRMLIFGTHKNIEMLETSQHWLADGTFKTAPALFQQVYVVHALRGEPDSQHDGHLFQVCSSFYQIRPKLPTQKCGSKYSRFVLMLTQRTCF